MEGPIGVGKGPVVQALAKRLTGSLYQDAPNPFLPSFYGDMEKFAFQVQLFFLLSRFQQQRDLAQGDLFASTVLCDYLFQKDRLFASLTLGPAEFALYEKVYSLLKGTIAMPDVVVYLQADVETILDRLSKKEEGIALLMPKAYLEDVVRAYQTFFFHFSGAPVIVCNTMKADFSKDPTQLDLLIEKMGEVKSGIHYLNP